MSCSQCEPAITQTDPSAAVNVGAAVSTGATNGAAPVLGALCGPDAGGAVGTACASTRPRVIRTAADQGGNAMPA